MYKVLKHYGTPRHSGRYPWGSGEDPQRSRSFLQEVSDLRKQGLSETEIATGLGIKTTQLRAKKSIAKAEKRRADETQAQKLKDKGYSNVEIGRRMGGINESSVRALLNPALQQRADITRITANMLKETVDKKRYVDVGAGVENHIGVSRTKLKTALEILKEEGYQVHKFDIEQVGTGKRTNMMVLASPDVTYSEVMKNKDKIKMTTDYSEDGGRTFLGLEPIRSVDGKRVAIRYAEDGGINKDGIIELRRGVDDISLGNAKYAQVRIGVDGTHYLKGMAMYSDDLPNGVDIMFNTNKKRNDAPTKQDVLKKMKTNDDGIIDPDNPFGSAVRQKHYIDKQGKDQLSALNIVNEEGDWGKWSKNLSSQMLSKQTPALAKKQLGLAYDIKKEEFDEITSLTNPIVKKKMLDSFSDDCDSASVHLKAAALPRQGTHVILPFPNMKPTEIYAPNYRDGEQVVLIRHPHGGTFEIPELTVNNKYKEAKTMMGGAKDGVGIHPKVAERLSGADFDGDTVLVIPNSHGDVKTSSALRSLKDFDPKESYAPYHGMVTIDGGIYNAETRKPDYEGRRPRTATKQMKMGDISNLITDMTIKGAGTDKIARAVKHSMVVIDSEKHFLDYKRSYVENGIGALKKEFQGKETGGASTLISKAKSEKRVNLRKDRPADPITGKKVYEYTGESFQKVKYRDPSTGKLKETTLGNAKKRGYEVLSTREVLRTSKSTKMAEEDDALKLSSGTPMETIYGTHANKLKALANDARKESINIKPIPQSRSAKETYAPEVAKLKADLNLALKNKPLERQAQLLANKIVDMKKQANPDMEPSDIKKIKGQALEEARFRTGAKKKQIEISDRQWEAIQAGAISTNTLIQILNNTDLDKVKRLATPRITTTMNPAKRARAESMLAAGRTQAEVADALGVSTSALSKALNS